MKRCRLCLELFSVNVLIRHEAGRDYFWICLRICSWRRAYFVCLSVSNRKYDDLQSTLNNKSQPFKFLQCTEIWTGMIWSEGFVFNYILNIYLWSCLCLAGKCNWICNEVVKRMRDEYFFLVTFISNRTAVTWFYREWKCLQYGNIATKHCEQQKTGTRNRLLK